MEIFCVISEALGKACCYGSVSEYRLDLGPDDGHVSLHIYTYRTVDTIYATMPHDSSIRPHTHYSIYSLRFIRSNMNLVIPYDAPTPDTIHPVSSSHN